MIKMLMVMMVVKVMMMVVGVMVTVLSLQDPAGLVDDSPKLTNLHGMLLLILWYKQYDDGDDVDDDNNNDGDVEPCSRLPSSCLATGWNQAWSELHKKSII